MVSLDAYPFEPLAPRGREGEVPPFQVDPIRVKGRALQIYQGLAKSQSGEGRKRDVGDAFPAGLAPGKLIPFDESDADPLAPEKSGRRRTGNRGTDHGDVIGFTHYFQNERILNSLGPVFGLRRPRAPRSAFPIDPPIAPCRARACRDRRS